MQDVTEIIRVQGMICRQCEYIISAALLHTRGIYKVHASYWRSQVSFEYDPDIITLDEINSVIDKAGYHVGKGGLSGIIIDLIALIAMIAILFLIKNSSLASFLPKAEQSMTLGVIFIVGLMTSVHCLGMCGGIMLSQTTDIAGMEIDIKKHSRQGRVSSFAYNFGRITAYTLVGGIVGLIGHAMSFSASTKGMILTISGLLVFVLGIQMSGVIPWFRKIPLELPSFCEIPISVRKRVNNRPFAIGLLTGLMPCGPLQAMQLYALGTGSFVSGALAMFVFALGTVPLMFAFGSLSSLVPGKYSKYMTKASVVLVTALGLAMLTNGLSLSGFSFMPDAVCCSVVR